MTLEVTRKFLESIAYATELIGNIKVEYFFHPTLILISSLILTFIAAFSNRIIPCLIILAYAITLIPILKCNIEHILKVSLITLLLASIPAIPLIIQAKYHTVSIVSSTNPSTLTHQAYMLILRSYTAALIFTVLMSYLGWKGILDALVNMGVRDERIIQLITLTVILPRILRKTARALAVRESRIVVKSYRLTWKILVTVLSLIIIACVNYAKTLMYAIKARTPYTGSIRIRAGRKIKLKDIAYITLTIVIAGLCIYQAI